MRIHIVFAVILATCVPASAEPLPKGAKPLSAKQIAGIYAGNSAKWDESMVYFAPDKTTKGVFGKPPSDLFTGTWKVTKNRICMTNVPVNIKSGKVDTRTYTDCWTYFSDNGTVVSSYHNDWREGEGPNENYNEGELSSLKKGDIVSKTFAKYQK